MSELIKKENGVSAVTAEKGSSLWDDAMIRLRKNKLAVVSFWFLVAMFILCFGYGSFIVFGENKIHTTQDLQNRFAEVGNLSLIHI